MSISEKLADKYDPSGDGAVGLIVGMIILGTIAATPVCALLGAGVGAAVAASSGGAFVLKAAAITGSLWGGSLAAGIGTLLIAKIEVPRSIYHYFYKRERKKANREFKEVYKSNYKKYMKDLKKCPGKSKSWYTAALNIRKPKKKSLLSKIFSKKAAKPTTGNKKTTKPTPKKKPPQNS